MVQFTLNGQPVRSTAHNTTPLLNVLANDLQINGTKFGCGKAQCGACLVLVDGNPVKSCVAPVSGVAGRSVTTLKGLKEGSQASRLQQAFMDEQAAQCGYCSNGWIMHTVALLEKTPKPSEAQIKEAFTNVQCRCGTQIAIMRAVKRASNTLSSNVKA